MAITNLHLEVTGDCSSTVAALGNTEAAIDHLSGRTAGVSASLSGSDRVISDLGRISDLHSSLSSAAPAVVGVDSSGISAARGEMRGRGSDVRDTASDFRNASGVLGGLAPARVSLT